MVAKTIRQKIGTFDDFYKSPDDEEKSSNCFNYDHIYLGSVERAKSLKSIEAEHQDDPAFTGLRKKLNDFVNKALPHPQRRLIRFSEDHKVCMDMLTCVLIYETILLYRSSSASISKLILSLKRLGNWRLTICAAIPHFMALPALMELSLMKTMLAT